MSTQAVSLSTLSAADLVIGLQSGTVKPVDAFQQFTTRLFPAGEMGTVYAQLAGINHEWVGPVASAQAQLAAKSKPASDRKTIFRAQGKRDICVRPPVKSADGRSAWTLTSPREAWLWLIDNADQLKAAIAEADRVDDDTLLREAVAKASKPAK